MTDARCFVILDVFHWSQLVIAKLLMLPLLALALLCGGCAADGIASPTAEVVAAKVTEQSDDGVRVEFTVMLKQTNNVPLPLTKSEADVTIGTAEPRSIKDVPHRTIPVGAGQGTGQQIVVIPISYPASSGIAPGSAYNINGSITYEPPGEVRRVLTESGIPLPTADFSKEGRLE